MINIKPECSSSAIGMLRGRHSTHAGWVGHDEYFLCDGKLWMIAPYGAVFRCDDEEEKAYLMRLIRNQRGARNA